MERFVGWSERVAINSLVCAQLELVRESLDAKLKEARRMPAPIVRVPRLLYLRLPGHLHSLLFRHSLLCSPKHESDTSCASEVSFIEIHLPMCTIFEKFTTASHRHHSLQ
jgi:hypothetical protein